MRGTEPGPKSISPPLAMLASVRHNLRQMSDKSRARNPSGGRKAQVVYVLDQVLSGDTVDAADIARVLGTTSRSVARWQTAEVSPRRQSEERLLEFKVVVDLTRRYLRPEPARLWLRSPHPEFSYERPLDLIARGEYRRVIGALLAMAEGVTA